MASMNKIKHLLTACALSVAVGAGPAQAEELSETGTFIDGVAAVVNEE